MTANLQTRQNFVDASGSRFQDPANQLHQELTQIDGSVRRTGRVSLRSLDHVIELAQLQQGNVSPANMAQLLRLTGEYLRQLSPVDRKSLTDTVWNLADPQRLDISHYNALLQIYLENGTSFDPHTFLDMLRDANIAPNRVTYQKLIQRFCDMGETKSANEMHELMIEEQLPVSERVFNALVKGHLLADDEAAARKVMEIMHSVELGPTAETYTVLACSLVEKGCGERALQTIDGRSLSDDQILRIAKAFALNDDIKSMAAVINKMPLTTGFVEDIVNTCLELLSLKRLEAARVILYKLPFNPSKKPYGAFFIRQMIRSGLPLDDVVSVCQELKTKHLNSAGLLLAVEMALRFSDRETALRFLVLMPQLGYNFRPHFFYPLLCKTTNDVEIYDTVRTMIKMKVPITNELLLDFVLPRVDCDSPESVVNRLVNCGCILSICVNAVAKRMLSEGEVEKCLAVIDAYKCDLSMYLATFAGEAATPANIDLCVEVLQKVFDFQMGCDAERVHRADPIGDFLKAVDNEMFDTAVLTINSRAKLKVKGTPRKSRMKRNQEIPFGGTALDKMLRSASRPTRIMTLSELEDHLNELEKNKSTTKPTTRDVVSCLLLRYCQARDIHKAEQMLQRLGGQRLSGKLLSSLMDLYVDVGDPETAFRYYLETLKLPNFKIDDRRVVGLAAAIIRIGELSEAKAILSNHVFDLTNSSSMEQMAAFLIRITTEKFGVNEAIKVLEEHVAGFVSVGLVHVMQIMHAVLESGDTDGSIRLFKYFANRYHLLALRHKLFLQLIADNNQKELANVRDICAHLITRAATTFDLAMCYGYSGQLEKARELLHEVPLRVINSKVKRITRSFALRGYVDILEEFVQLVLQLTPYDKEELYYQLIRGYCNTGNTAKALDLWTRAQEENVVLSQHTLRYLARRLQLDGHKAPFVTSDEQQPPVNLNDSEDEKDYINEKIPVFGAAEDSIEGVLKFSEQELSVSPEFRVESTNKLILALTEDGRIELAFDIMCQELQGRGQASLVGREYKIVNFVLTQMARRGMVEQIALLRALLDYEFCDLCSIDFHLCNAYQHANRGDEYLEILDTIPPAAILSGKWANAIIENYPRNYLRVLQNAKRFAREGGNYQTLIHFWLRFVAEDQLSQAEALMAEFPRMFEHYILFGKARQRNQDSVKVLERLLTLLKPTTPMQQLYALFLSDYIDVLVSKGCVDEAHSSLRKASSAGLDINLCKIKSLRNLAAELSHIGKEVDFPIPTSSLIDLF
ncbi:leucine-rich PPR motif-containing protein, mitochondrial-like isoform X2 [Varroa jacobsoni]|nr:leucine-rich PPR motif-containing protein, mitochondrial-like isoform X2 [Varroa jacobsoni]